MLHLVGDPEVKEETRKIVRSVSDEFVRADGSPVLPGTWHNAK